MEAAAEQVITLPDLPTVSTALAKVAGAGCCYPGNMHADSEYVVADLTVAVLKNLPITVVVVRHSGWNQ